MLKKLLFLLLMLTPAFAKAQSAFDSLKNIYTAQYVFEQREKGSADAFIKKILAEIKKPEIRQLTAIAVAENLYGYGGWVNNKNLLKLIDEVIAQPQTEEVRITAENVKAEILRSLIGTKIQEINLPAPAGDTLHLTRYYSSSFDYTVVDLWATWCGPCIAEMKKFNDLKKTYNIEFYSISLDDDISKVQKFVKRNLDYTWPIVFAGKGSPLWDYFKARLIPAFVIVDKNGIIVAHVVGKGLEDALAKLYRK